MKHGLSLSGVIRPGIILSLLLLAFWGIRDCPAQKSKVREAEQKIKSSKSELEKIEEEIQAGASQERGLKKKERNLLSEIQEFEQQIEESQKKLTSLNLEIDELTAEIAYISRQLESCHQQLENKKAILNRRLREIYKRGRLHQVSVLIGSHSFTDLLKRFKYLTLIAAQDKRLVAEVSELRHSYLQYLGANENMLALMIQRKATLEEEKQNLERAENERQKLLHSVKSQRAELLKVIEQRKTERETIRQLIAEWERRRREAVEQARREGRVLPPETAHLDGRQGKLEWPLTGGKLIRGFGPYVDEATRTKVISNGIDIQTQAGQEVRSVGDGLVMFVEWYRTYGKTVMVDHGAGMYSLYTHLGEVYVEVGEMVGAGQVIALVGSTGSLEGPMLHFELRNRSKSVDPLLWLRKR
ncbi:MAG: peptidoglycan DD-metalloendopeptidase family protein [Candidatus Glassbacteria bacterium]|nr:peptidoglycan DD-metalloendopeptidase family protein [Candidatus Glassbacteria bacterium]